jgi:predicted dehydrogenase
MEPLRIGLIGCGNISGIYFRNLSRFPETQIVACADLNEARAQEAARQNGIAKALSPDDLIADPEVEAVLNLTIPAAHFAIAHQAVEAGKHVYNEKPLTVHRADGEALMAAAAAQGVRVGCAPDTFLGAGIQTARAVLDSGAIGEPVGVQGFMIGHGPEGWHPAPEFFYKDGGGPMMDMGPYYLTAFVNLLGPIRRVTGSVRASLPTRTVGSGPLKGHVITVETPTHYVGVLDFANGAIGEICTSFDVWHTRGLHPIAVYGTEGSMLVPDPNTFGGEVLVRGRKDSEWHPAPVKHAFGENARGVGLLDLAYAVRENRDHRASGALALHVLDVMLGIREAGEQGVHQPLAERTGRPEALHPDAYAEAARSLS